MPQKKKNAFFFFMQELHREMANRGENVSFAQMSNIASPHWKGMTPEQKLKYQNMAKADRGEPQTPVPNHPMAVPDEPMRDTRMNNQRVLMSDFDADIASKRDKAKAREDEVKSLRFSWPPGNQLTKEIFYIIHAEYFVETQEGAVLPCEVSVVKMSLAGGIVDVYHTFIDPGPPPSGYTGEELSRSEARHQIPTFDRFDHEDFDLCEEKEEADEEGGNNDKNNNDKNDDDEDDKSKEPVDVDKRRRGYKNYTDIYCNLVRFFDDGSPNKRAFTDARDVNMVQSCLDWIFEHARPNLGLKHNQNDLARVLPLGNLVQQFFMHSQSANVHFTPSLNSVEIKLANNKWNYASNTRCFFHEAKDVSFCTTGQVRRWCFSIFDAMQSEGLYSFDMTANHVPPKPTTAFRVVAPGDITALPAHPNVSAADVDSAEEEDEGFTKVCRSDRRPEFRGGKGVIVVKETGSGTDITGELTSGANHSTSNDTSLASSFSSLGISGGESRAVGGGVGGVAGSGGAFRGGFGRGIVRDHVDAALERPNEVVEQPRRLGLGRGKPRPL